MGARGGKAGSILALASALNVDRNEIKSQQSGIVQPPPLFPPVEFKHIPLVEDNDFLPKDSYDYVVGLKRSLMTTFREGPFYIETETAVKDIDRYTDKLKKSPVIEWQPRWNRLPAELQPVNMRAQSSGAIAVKRRKVDDRLLPEKLAKLEKREAIGAANEEKTLDTSSVEGGDEENKEEIPEDEEAVEEDEEISDYVQSYFDAGEDYVDDSADENPDEATY